MSDPTHRIKNLSIALEALSRISRIPQDTVPRAFALLEAEIIKQEKKHGLKTAWPAMPSTDNKDDIPF